MIHPDISTPIPRKWNWTPYTLYRNSLLTQIRKQKCACSEAVIWPWDNTRPRVHFLPWRIWFNAALSWTRVSNKAQQENTRLWAELRTDAEPNGHFNALITRWLLWHDCNSPSGFKAVSVLWLKLGVGDTTNLNITIQEEISTICNTYDCFCWQFINQTCVFKNTN